MELTLRCFACKRDLKPVQEGRTQPYGGLSFASRGSYGSRLYDPSLADPNVAVVVLICDECLREREDLAFARVIKEARPDVREMPLQLDKLP